MEPGAEARSMKAVVFDGRLWLAEDYPVPEPAAGDVRVRVLALSLIHISEPTRPY